MGKWTDRFGNVWDNPPNISNANWCHEDYTNHISNQIKNITMPNRKKTALQIAKEIAKEQLDYKPPKCGYYWHDDFTIFSVYDSGETDTKRYEGVAQTLNVEKDVTLLIGSDDIVSFTVVKKRTKIKV